jgi:hypothetical protein
LTTSRERLDVPGEFVFPVPPLGLPEGGSAGAVAASEAGCLFVTRARAASPGFALDAGNAAARLLAAADAARRALQYLGPGFTANRGAAAHAASQARHVLGDDRSPRHRKKAGDSPSTTRWPTPPARAAAANAPPRAGPA